MEDTDLTSSCVDVGGVRLDILKEMFTELANRRDQVVEHLRDKTKAYRSLVEAQFAEVIGPVSPSNKKCRASADV